VSNWFVLSGAIGIICSVASLAGMAIALGRENRWGMVLACLGAMSIILFLTLVGIEYADDFWKGRS
jgi:hypothetical protein